jgi:hypothetical protein
MCKPVLRGCKLPEQPFLKTPLLCEFCLGIQRAELNTGKEHSFRNNKTVTVVTKDETKTFGNEL